jgi:predicted component of type VI protein secretion system
LDWLNSHTQPGAAVAFSEISDYYVASLRDRRRLRTEVTDRRLGEFRWYVLQNRAGLLNAAERTLIHSEKPVYTKYTGHHVFGVPGDLKVPLILVFSYEQHHRAVLSSGLE